MSQVKCPKCQALQARRTEQKGFFQKLILQKLGYFPWQCRFCKSEFVLRNRGPRSSDGKRSGRRKTHSHEQVSSHMSAD